MFYIQNIMPMFKMPLILGIRGIEIVQAVTLTETVD